MPTTTTDRVADTLRTLDDGLRSLADSDQWAAYLRTLSRFHHYSAFNVGLILWQCPDASQVAGYRTWQELGRQVRKGESGLRILAPRTRKAEDDDGEPIRVVTGFRAVAVFDIGQTDGPDLPEPVARLEGSESHAEHAWPRLVGVAHAASVTVTRSDLAGKPDSLNGYYVRAEASIVIREGLPRAHQVKTLAHELAHHFTETDCTRPMGEIIAESTAYVVTDALGIDAGRYSFGYVLGWAGGDLEAVKTTATDVQRIAHQLLEALEA